MFYLFIFLFFIFFFGGGAAAGRGGGLVYSRLSPSFSLSSIWEPAGYSQLPHPDLLCPSVSAI